MSNKIVFDMETMPSKVPKEILKWIQLDAGILELTQLIMIAQDQLAYEEEQMRWINWKIKEVSKLCQKTP